MLTQLRGGIDVKMLTEYAASFEGTVVNQVSRGHRPPKITVIDGLATNDVSPAGLPEPSFGNNPFIVDHAILLNEHTEASIIPQSCANARTC